MRYIGVFLIGMVVGAFLLFALAAFAAEREAEEREKRWWEK